MKKSCLFCAAVTTVALNSYGFYICEKCGGHEVHDDEPVKIATEIFNGLKVIEMTGTQAASGVSLSSLQFTTMGSSIEWSPRT